MYYYATFAIATSGKKCKHIILSKTPVGASPGGRFAHAARRRQRGAEAAPQRQGGSALAAEILEHVDLEIGGRIRLRRAMLGLSQKQLGDAIGLTPQQVQKYEKGINRIAASTLFIVAEALNVPVSFFFDGLLKRRLEGQEAGSALLVDRRETLDLLRAYHKVDDARLRRQFIDFIREIARMSGAAPR